MVIASLIVGIFTLLATIAIPIISRYKNRLRFNISMVKTTMVEINSYYNFIACFHVNNQSKYPINIHKIELLTNHNTRYGKVDCSPVRNKLIDENEESEFEVVFEQLYKSDKPIKINILTNKKNYSFSISEA